MELTTDASVVMQRRRLATVRVACLVVRSSSMLVSIWFATVIESVMVVERWLLCAAKVTFLPKWGFFRWIARPATHRSLLQVRSTCIPGRKVGHRAWILFWLVVVFISVLLLVLIILTTAQRRLSS